ncbi:MAG: DUF1800 domain-containing protein [Candidatus Eremiobacterota bacterium]
MRGWLLLLLLVLPVGVGAEELYFPYREAGLTREEAAAHLLNRFAYGPRPGEVDWVARQGLEKWFAEQLRGQLPSPVLDGALTAVPEESSEWALRERKLLRAVYDENQLHEVLVDFWFNHFNVSLTDDDCRPFVASYERVAIRPYILGDFRDMLGATAHHPAMLYYLDNAYSEAAPVPDTVVEGPMDPLGYGPRERRSLKTQVVTLNPGERKGLNENYARELMELHTLGVDGGYRQQDVTEVARIFTGWTVDRKDQVAVFVFRPERHDARSKKVMGTVYQPSGQDEGEKILDRLSRHASTARFVTRKLAVRFVSDNPPRSLTARLEREYLGSGGDLKRVLVALLESPEFWQRSSLRAKVKSPFELTASAIRAVGGKLAPRSGVQPWIEQMGQEVYSCRPPTGFPDRADHWINTGNLLNRMNFGMKLASNQIGGVQVDVPALKTRRNPRTPEEALRTYAEALLPGRDVGDTVKTLTPSVLDPNIARKIEAMAAGKKGYPQATPGTRVEMSPETAVSVVGILLGSPEFQRR